MATTEPSEIERPDLSELDDGALVQLARDEVHDAYATLYRRHANAAQRLARHLGMRDEADDVVSESFAQVLELMRRGKGPETSFRAYLFTTIRHDCRPSRRRRGRSSSPRMTSRRSTPWSDSMPDSLTPSRRPRFAPRTRLCRRDGEPCCGRWRSSAESPRTSRPRSGLSPNGVSALAYRARSALREAYLKQHVRTPPSSSDRSCREARDEPPCSGARHAAASPRGTSSRAPARLRRLQLDPARARSCQHNRGTCRESRVTRALLSSSPQVI